MSTMAEVCNFPSDKENHQFKPSKIDPIIAVLEEYVRAVEKYEKHGEQAVASHHKNNIALLKDWDNQQIH